MYDVVECVYSNQSLFTFEREIYEITMMYRHNSQGCQWLCLLLEYIGVPEQALGWFPIDLELVVEDEPFEIHVCASLSISASLSIMWQGVLQ